MEFIAHVFSYVCDRHHCWCLGGEWLPFCQRCTGLYVGAALSAALHLCLRPRPTSLSLWVHGLLLLLMVPFGYHLVPQNGLVRTLTGQLFAVGLVGYLLLLPLSLPGPETEKRRPSSWYALGVLGSVIALQWSVHSGGLLVGMVLAWLGLFGFAALGALAVANAVLIPTAILRLLQSRRVTAAS